MNHHLIFAGSSCTIGIVGYGEMYAHLHKLSFVASLMPDLVIEQQLSLEEKKFNLRGSTIWRYTVIKKQELKLLIDCIKESQRFIY